MFVVSVTGGIASGKGSTCQGLANSTEFRQELERRGYQLRVKEENLDEWGKEELVKSYQEPEKYSLSFQYKVLEWQRRERDRIKTECGDTPTVVIMERTSYDGMAVFVPLKVSLGHISEDGATQYVEDAKKDGLFASLTVFLDVDPEERWARVQRRGQTGDEDIEKNYLERENSFLREAYRAGVPDMVLETREGGVTREEAVDRVAKLILGRILPPGASDQ